LVMRIWQCDHKVQIYVRIGSVSVSGIASAYGDIQQIVYAYANEFLEVLCDLQQMLAHHWI